MRLAPGQLKFLSAAACAGALLLAHHVARPADAPAAAAREASNIAANAAEPTAAAAAAAAARADRFRKHVEPILAEFCSDCHADGAKKGNVALDAFTNDDDLVANRALWFNVLKHVRADLMPPAKKPQPSGPQKQAILHWIKSDVLLIDPARPDPGNVTVHRLNRAEYRNTIRDLMGVEFDTDAEFPADDAGFGFDNISDALTLSPMLLEKYLSAADAVVTKAVPTVAYVMDEQVVKGSRFTPKLIDEPPPSPAEGAAAPPTDGAAKDGARPPQNEGSRSRQSPFLALSYYKRSTATYSVDVKADGQYRILLNLLVKGNFAGSGFDDNKARVAFAVDGKEQFRGEFAWAEREEVRRDVEVELKAGQHELRFDLTPLTPGVKQTTDLQMRVEEVTVRGPVDRTQWVRPPNYAHFFPEQTPDDPAGRKAAARVLLSDFARRAFRRPADEGSVSQLAELAERIWSSPGCSYEQGIAKAMTAVLSSPRFLYREEQSVGGEADRTPLIDEYSLASRLSYFLWSSAPDDELLTLAGRNELRKNLSAQVKRMLADSKASAFTENFTGQWLEARDVMTVPVNARRVIDDEQLRRTKLDNGDVNRRVRQAMQDEVRGYFSYVVESDRDVTEFIDSDYTFLNQRLADYYGVPDVKGDEFRKVVLPPGSPRGGILTMGATLMVTSNPTRTSPVKRGLFILDNVIGMPPPPAPPDVATLEEAVGKIKDHVPTLREQLAVHRESPQCASCHNRMDPLGLSLENFNALGLWRDDERGRPIDSAGVLITGERFQTVQQLKTILSTGDRRIDFYRCLTEKLLTYALGRGVDHRDVSTIDEIVSNVEKAQGRFSALLTGVIESPAFQRTQLDPVDETSLAK